MRFLIHALENEPDNPWSIRPRNGLSEEAGCTQRECDARPVPNSRSTLRGPEAMSKPQARRMAPEVGFEPTTNRLTADRSTTELLWIVLRPDAGEFCAAKPVGQVIIGQVAD
ncbi:MAG: hypothetical protein QOD64_515 [Verrucomicrobiota bacterium]